MRGALLEKRVIPQATFPPVPLHRVPCSHVISDISWMRSDDKPLVWVRGEVKSPPFSARARIEAGILLRRLQRGEKLALPHSRPLAVIGPRCHELRVRDENKTWRIVYRTDPDAIVIVEVFEKKSRETPKRVIQSSQARLRRYDELGRSER